jgi:hypothetical protein
MQIGINENKEILYKKRIYTLQPIRKELWVESKETGLPNTNIGVIDLETYEEDSIGKCYAIGFYVGGEKSVCYYIDKDRNSYDLIQKCINELLRYKYKDIIFYIHNLGRFDAPYIIKALSVFNNTIEGKENPYILESVSRNSDIIKLIIKRKINKRLATINIYDSVAMLPMRLRDLCKDYEISIEKGYFPYRFCNKNTLFYIGKMPDITFYDDISSQEYNSLNNDV